MQVSRETKRGTAISIAIALLLHLLLFAPFLHLLLPDPDRDLEALYRTPETTPYELLLEPDEENTPDDQERQIVSIDAPETMELPDEARFEDRVHRRVEEETRARDRGQPEAPTRPSSEPQPPPRPAERSERQERQARAESPTDADEAARLIEEEAVPIEDEIAAVFDPSQRGAQPARRSRPDDPNRENEREEPPESRLDLSAFRPSYESARDFVAVPGAPSRDHLDLPQGERDQLNSFENMYWSYWDRIKNQVRPHWRPSRVYRERDPTGRIFGVEDRYTVLRVTLNGDGTLRHVYLERASDLDFLDREAVRAIRAAEPFTNVPEGLKDARGLLSFRFGFYFEVNSASFRIRREDW